MFTGALTIDGGALLAKEPEKKNRTGFSLGFGKATSSSAQGGLQLAMGMRRTVAMEENLSTLAPFEEYQQVHLESIKTFPPSFPTSISNTNTSHLNCASTATPLLLTNTTNLDAINTHTTLYTILFPPIFSDFPCRTWHFVGVLREHPGWK